MCVCVCVCVWSTCVSVEMETYRLSPVVFSSKRCSQGGGEGQTQVQVKVRGRGMCDVIEVDISAYVCVTSCGVCRPLVSSTGLKVKC